MEKLEEQRQVYESMSSNLKGLDDALAQASKIINQKLECNCRSEAAKATEKAKVLYDTIFQPVRTHKNLVSALLKAYERRKAMYVRFHSLLQQIDQGV